MFVTIKGRRHYLWRAVDQDGDTLDILVRSRRNQRAAERFFRKLLKGEGASPRQLVTDIRLRQFRELLALVGQQGLVLGGRSDPSSASLSCYSRGSPGQTATAVRPWTPGPLGKARSFRFRTNPGTGKFSRKTDRPR